ncbi:hypothetical protein [Virgibacillus salexigens]|uniref:Uncharacterized protein n=1 Tax=Virgibacillus kapii TaxID=1638645 RepID=A0ABQ2DXU8_9BACI|nr:hypothetical protein [Virgibacillus kapii]GGJ77854.1 hypothetical protein GCM10007111_44230 [Virgibacillus kapii]
MSMKKGILLLISALSLSLILFSTISAQVQTKEDRLSEVTDIAWNNYDVVASSVLSEEKVLFFDIADTENKEAFKNDMRKQLDDRNINYSLKFQVSNVDKIKEKRALEEKTDLILNYLRKNNWIRIYPQFKEGTENVIFLNVNENAPELDLNILEADVLNFINDNPKHFTKNHYEVKARQ